MRFIGNKEAIVQEIYELLKEKKLTNKNLTFFDAFAGTGSVADFMKDKFNIIINDMLNWCVLYSKGRLLNTACTFKKLKFDPFFYFNENDTIVKGFFYKNYTPAESNRMYFTEKNGGRIDYFRTTIENWKENDLINDQEYAYLLRCLIESMSLVANTAGVYGAFLKHWDNRALKNIEFIKGNSLNNKKVLKTSFYNEKIENIIEEIECDILYLDPPYTQNQYGTQYHLIETLVLYDNPSISLITGSRKTTSLRSDWSKNFKSHILLDRLIAKTKAKYIVLSYNVDGFMSKQFIEACLKRYGKADTYVCKEIEYKKYRNWKTKRTNEHFEYLFYIEKKEEKDIEYESPLNYIGSKYRFIKQLKELMPKEISSIYDIFGGGFNVGINIFTNNIIYNDYNWIVKELVESFRKYDTYEYLMYIQKIRKKFNLEINNKESYFKAREYYNSIDIKKRDPRFLYTLILYGFQQQIRFNSKLEFNNPVGMRWFNELILEKMISFSRRIKERQLKFYSENFDFFLGEIDKKAFIYMDPPYRLTLGSYNDGKRGFRGWDIEQEKQLMRFIDKLNNNGNKFMFSYVLEHNGEFNQHIKSWVEHNGYFLIELKNIPGRKRKEVVIINYEIL